MEKYNKQGHKLVSSGFLFWKSGSHHLSMTSGETVRTAKPATQESWRRMGWHGLYSLAKTLKQWSSRKRQEQRPSRTPGHCCWWSVNEDTWAEALAGPQDSEHTYTHILLPALLDSDSGWVSYVSLPSLLPRGGELHPQLPPPPINLSEAHLSPGHSATPL